MGAQSILISFGSMNLCNLKYDDRSLNQKKRGLKFSNPFTALIQGLKRGCKDYGSGRNTGYILYKGEGVQGGIRG